MIGQWLLNPLYSGAFILTAIMLTLINPLVGFVGCLIGWVVYDLINDYSLRNGAYRYKVAARERGYWVGLAMQGAEQIDREG